MSYDNLNDYVSSLSAPRWLKKTREEIWRLLGIKDLTESNQIIKFYYYKTPFEEDAKEDSQRQIIAFTDSKLIIGTPIFDSNRRIKSIELQTIRVSDIQKLVLKTSAYDDPDVVVALEISMRDGSIISLYSNDANDNWRYAYAEHIQEIAQYLLHTI
jgi:hypothetical protein